MTSFSFEEHISLLFFETFFDLIFEFVFCVVVSSLLFSLGSWICLLSFASFLLASLSSGVCSFSIFVLKGVGFFDALLEGSKLSSFLIALFEAFC